MSQERHKIGVASTINISDFRDVYGTGVSETLRRSPSATETAIL